MDEEQQQDLMNQAQIQGQLGQNQQAQAQQQYYMQEQEKGIVDVQLEVETIKTDISHLIRQDVLVIDNYPMGFKRCTMTFKKTTNRNGYIVERTSLFNGKVSKPKKNTASNNLTFIYDTDLKYDDGGGSTIEFRRSKIDCLSLVSDIEDLKGIYNDTALTYDKMAIEYAINDVFNFNAVLIYYTV